MTLDLRHIMNGHVGLLVLLARFGVWVLVSGCVRVLMCAPDSERGKHSGIAPIKQINENKMMTMASKVIERITNKRLSNYLNVEYFNISVEYFVCTACGNGVAFT